MIWMALLTAIGASGVWLVILELTVLRLGA